MSDRKPVEGFPRAQIMDDRRSLPIALLRAREAVMAYFRPHHRKGGITEQQWRVIRVLYLDGETDATTLARRSYLLAPSLSRILKDLEAAGYVRRRPGSDDFPAKPAVAVAQGIGDGDARGAVSRRHPSRNRPPFRPRSS